MVQRTVLKVHLSCDKCKTKMLKSISGIPGADKKRCHNRLNKGRMDLEYLKQVQEELLSMKSSNYVDDGPQELNYVMESLVHRIQHGNNNRVEEAKLYHEIRNLSDTTEIYAAPTGPNEPDSYWLYRYRPRSTVSEKQYRQQIVLNQLVKARTVRRYQLNLELDLLRKRIRCMERVLEKISLRTKKAYKCAYKLGEQQNRMKSSNNEYRSLMTYVKEQAQRESVMTYVKELARIGDIEELMQVCDRQLLMVAANSNL
ncbi:hypothetical protein CTI12_AA239210 [Artemisia annua]|uniref:Uncharacterized protein n=1 Tax=Artemisia annua TaxID=35608 RepID=A0A2U1NQS1_ARTAN|nr:hypothetical protein CTI12_AA239210 [Artemisia annua]